MLLVEGHAGPQRCQRGLCGVPARRDRPNCLSRQGFGVPCRPRRRPRSQMPKMGVNVGLTSIPRRISLLPEPERIERTVRRVAVRGPRPGCDAGGWSPRSVVSHRGGHRDVAVLGGQPRGVHTGTRWLHELRSDRTASHIFGHRVVGRRGGVKGARAVAVQEKLAATRKLCLCGRNGSRTLGGSWGLPS